MFLEQGGSVRVMPFTIKLLEMCGLRGSRKRRICFYLAWIWTLAAVTIPKVFHEYAQNDFMVCNVAELIFHFNTEFKIMIFAWKMANIEQLVAIVRGIYCRVRTTDRDSPAEKMVEEVTHRTDKRSKAYFLYVMISASVIIVTPLTQNCVNFFRSIDNHTEKLEYVPYMEQGFYGLNIRGNFGHYAIYAIGAGSAHYIAAAMFCITDIILFASIICTIVLFKLVATKVQKIDEFSGQVLVEELAEIIEFHVDGLKCIELLESFANLAMMVQIMNWAFSWVSLVLCLGDEFDMIAMNRIIMIVIITGETYALCDLGTQLTDESLAVCNAMYSCQWYNLPVDVQKSLSLLLHRAQKREGITAAKFFYMDREQFANVAQTSYSMYFVLKERL